MKKQLLAAIGLAILMNAGASMEASAQDCREHCPKSCSDPTHYQSSGFNNPNGFGGSCGAPFCSKCGEEAAVRNAPAVAEVILSAVRLGRPFEMKTIAKEYAEYMLVHVDRQLLVIKGLGCEPEGLGAIMPLSREKTDALREAGVRDLAEFISNRGPLATIETQG